jgi:hypothetical protein
VESLDRQPGLFADPIGSYKKNSETAPAAALPSLACLDRGIGASIAWSASLHRPSSRGPAHLATGTQAAPVLALPQTISVLQRHEAHGSVAQERESKLSPADLC